jgi:hypothetical protein
LFVEELLLGHLNRNPSANSLDWGRVRCNVSGWLTCGTGMFESAYFVVINFSTTLPTSCNTKSRCSHLKQSARSLGIDFSIVSWRTLLYEAIKSNRSR